MANFLFLVCLEFSAEPDQGRDKCPAESLVPQEPLVGPLPNASRMPPGLCHGLVRTFLDPGDRQERVRRYPDRGPGRTGPNTGWTA